ncbi:MAG: hypothetical protein WBL90_06035 [bacterium]
MSLTVKLVTSDWELQVFLELPYRIYASNPYWVPPSPGAERWRLNPRENPFFAHAEGCSFLAWRGKEAVGRITAIVDAANPDQEAGTFGFFEVEEDGEGAAALLAAAADWLRSRGRRRMLGPFTLSSNEETGLLVEGFAAIPPVGLGYSLPYYPRLLEEGQLRKIKDYLAYSWDLRQTLPDRLAKVARYAQRKNQLQIKHFSLGGRSSEAAAFQYLYNNSMEGIWGFTPLSRREAREILRGLAQYADPELLLVGERRGEPVALCLSLPDINPVRQKNRGVLPRGRAWHREVQGFRLAVLGVVPQARCRGLEAPLLLTTLELATAKGYQEASFSLVLEDNIMMNRVIARLVPDARVTSRYRIYGLEL